MNTIEFTQALEQARRELAHAIQARDKWNLEVVRLHNLVKTLAFQAQNAQKAEEIQLEMQHQIGIAQAIEALVNGSQNPVSATDIRDSLLFYGYDIGRYANPLALIHQTLKRLAANRRIREIRGTGRYTRSPFYESLLKA